MLSSKLRLLILAVIFHFGKTIKDGKLVEENKRYLVYLIRAPGSPREYDSWVCGGAIVNRFFIITSAACVEDVQNMYAIAGYSKLVRPKDLQTDPCTQVLKSRITFTCVPKSYDFSFEKVERWSFIDIAAVKVEFPYNFTDSRYTSLCSYIPAPIPINYETKYQEPGLDALVLGWGHLQKWRIPGDTFNYNQERVHFASIRLHDKNQCKRFFTEIPSMDKIIENYMICTLEAGNIDEKGNLILKSNRFVEGCTHEQLRDVRVMCEEDGTVLIDSRKTFSNILMRQQNMTRKQGFCQNDHGGPIVTWAGTHEVLIGVASVFRVNAESVCTGPYLYTSTQCNGAFLDCVVNEGTSTGRRRQLCDRDPREKGFDTIEKHISWTDYPDGLVDNGESSKAPLDEYDKMDGEDIFYDPTK